ncbi:MAG: hypothetical protein Q8R79_01605 [Legionellaceae bacterium]|nr:hypothetical protein [Legionellaceae bacterium]
MSHYADLRFSDEEAITLYLYAKDKQKFHGDRYEFWIYRQMKKRLKAGELYLSDSIHHRSLQQEISSANEKGALVQPNQNIIG